MKNRRWWLGLALAMVSFSPIISQGTVKGRISDENGEALIGVTVFLKEEPGTGVATDLDGNYSLKITSGIEYTLVISYMSYETIEEKAIAEDGQVIILDFTLKPATVTLGAVEIVSKQEKRNQYYMENIKKKSANTLDYISGDLMSRIGDNNISAAIARVTGVATTGPFITVRGLGDRYIQTCVNGALIPTLDPFTNNIKLDLFPSSFVDNIIITKTASPDIQGDWAAAYISIETRDQPDKLSISFESKITFNTQSTFNEAITNETSSTDWLGFDNGFRDVDHANRVSVNPTPSAYEQFCALGLKSYYRSLGITESWVPGSHLGDTYFKLGLIELGLLGKAFINDEQAVGRAMNSYYAGEYQNEAFKIINKDAEKSLDDFANNWDTHKEKVPLNFSQNFSIGNQTSLFGNPFSFLAGFRYGNITLYDPKSTFSRTLSAQLDTTGQPIIDQKYHQEYARYTNGWTALATTNYKLGPHHSFSLLFMPNIIGINNIRQGVDLNGSSSYKYAFIQGQYYEERSQFTYQYKSEHFLPGLRTRLQLSASYADGQSNVPDFKRLQYFSDDSIHYRLDKTISDVRRDFRYLDEDILDTKVAFEISLDEKAGYVSKLKLGGSFVDKQREFTQYDYLLRQANGVTTNFTYGRLNELFYDERFDIRTDSVTGITQIDLFYRPFNDPANHTIGYSRVTSAFAMIDKSITQKLRISGGLRAEYSEVFSDVKEFHDLGYAPDDLRRNSSEISFILTPSNLKQWNYLPSINFIYQLRSDEISPSNLRLNYSRSIARPSIREYSETVVYDFELAADVFGNADLKFVEIDNYDVRYENYFPGGHFISTSVFYKNFKNHIELTGSNIGFTWSNAQKSNVYGFEIEGRLKLGPQFEFRANMSAVKSYTKVEERSLLIENGVKSWVVLGITERAMFGQAPYVVNGILNYTGDKGFSASLSYNVQGPKLVLTSLDYAPDIYEMPKHLLNLKITQPLFQHFSLSLTAKDILNGPVRRTYQYNEGYILDFDHYRYGTEFSIAIAYNL